MKDVSFVKRLGESVKKNVSFFVVLLITFLALTLIVATTFGLFYSNAKKDAITIGNMTVISEAKRINDILTVGLNTIEMSAISVDYMLENDKTPAEVQAFMIQETIKIKESIDSSFSCIYGVVNNVYVDGTEWDPGVQYDPYQRPWYLAAKKNGQKPTIVSPYIDAETGGRMISFSKILSDGVSAISLDMWLENIYDATNSIEGKGFCVLLDSNGVVVSHYDDSQKDKNYLEDEEHKALVEKAFASGGTEFEMKYMDSRCMVFSQNVLEQWHLVLIVNSSELFWDVRINLLESICISLIIFILVGYFCTSNYFNKQKALKYADEVRTDKLTGLNNRGEFDRFLATTIDVIPIGQKLYLMLLDADDFKAINDKYGHSEGDRALKLIAECLKTVATETNCFCARYGGDEFVFVCKCENDETLYQIAENVSQKLNQIKEINQLPYSLSLSVGFAAFDQGNQTITELIDNADAELYKEKMRRNVGR